MSQNPYVEKLADEIIPIAATPEFPEALLGRSRAVAIAEYVLAYHITPRNQKIHNLTSEVARLNAHINRLGKVLERHNAGVCKAGESPIDCAIRMLSPVRDDTPKRDRP